MKYTRPTLILCALAAAITLVFLVLRFGMAFLLERSDEVHRAHLFQADEPLVVWHLEVVDEDGDLVWAIDNLNGQVSQTIDYGRVPKGFIQRYPNTLAPRELRQGERVRYAFSSKAERWMGANARYVGGLAFKQGVTASGTGCKQPKCAEIFRIAPL